MALPYLKDGYTEKSIAVFGNTTPYAEQLLKLGGTYNRRLKENDNPTPGWVFAKTKRDIVVQFLTGIKEGKIKPDTNTSSSSNSYNSESRQTSVVNSAPNNELQMLKRTVMSLTTRVEQLEQLLSLLTKSSGIVKTQPSSSSSKLEDTEIEFEDDDEETDSRPRLMASVRK